MIKRPVAYVRWPFRSPASWSVEEAARWWQECYVPGPMDALEEGPHWRILLGGPGSGKTIALMALAHRETPGAFLIPYPPERWPGSPRAWLPGKDHLAQIMGAAAIALRDHLIERPHSLSVLGDVHKEFLRWLMEKYLGSRAFRRWIEDLPPEHAEAMSRVSYQDLFPTTTQPLDVQGQIDELVSLIRRLGYSWVRVLSDFNQTQASLHRRALRELLEWHDLMIHPGFRVALALPREIWEKEDLTRFARGRIGVLSLTWSRDQVREIALRHLRAALSVPSQSLEDWMDPELQAEVEQWLCDEYGGYAPAGWVAWVETVLYLALEREEPLQPPLNRAHVREVLRTLCARHMPLRIDREGHGVWRGPRWIPLTEQPFNFLRVLWERRGAPIDASDERLRAALGSRGATKANVHTLAARIRRQIEPFPDQPVYLVNRREEGGYCLENFVE